MDVTGDAAVSGPASTAGDDDEPLSGGQGRLGSINRAAGGLAGGWGLQADWFDVAAGEQAGLVHGCVGWLCCRHPCSAACRRSTVCHHKE